MGDSYIDAVMDQTVFGRLGDKIMASTVGWNFNWIVTVIKAKSGDSVVFELHLVD